MKALFFALCGVFVLDGLGVEAAPWQPAPGFKQLRLWSGKIPSAQAMPGPEVTTTDKKSLIGGKTVEVVTNVSQPTMTVYWPKGKNTGAAVLVFPGGGYKILAMDLEGTEVCDWLTSKGITGILLKYRVPNLGAYPRSPVALQDAQRAMGLVHLHAAEWHIDPHKVGVLGFSAGGHLSAAISTHFSRRLYPAVDAADKENCRPDFAVVIYPGHLSIAAHTGEFRQFQHLAHKDFALNPNVPVTKQTPPTFLLQDEDDHVDSVDDSLVYYIALKKAGVPVEMHLYAQGGHAFGLRRTKFPVTAWPQLVETWLHTISMISE